MRRSSGLAVLALCFAFSSISAHAETAGDGFDAPRATSFGDVDRVFDEHDRIVVGERDGAAAAPDCCVPDRLGRGLLGKPIEFPRLGNVPVLAEPAGQVTDAFPWDEAPRHLIRDHDKAFGTAYTRRIRAMEIRDHPTAPHSPSQNGHVERRIGSIRRDSLDHLIVISEAHLRAVLKACASYYNKVRPHLSLDKDAPDFRRTQKIGRIAAIPILGGLHHKYVRV